MGPFLALRSTPRRANISGSGAPPPDANGALLHSRFNQPLSPQSLPHSFRYCAEKFSHQLQSFHGVPHSFAKTTRVGHLYPLYPGRFGSSAKKCRDFISGQTGKTRYSRLQLLYFPHIREKFPLTPLLPTLPQTKDLNPFISHTSKNTGVGPPHNLRSPFA
jgi:hypothetical protein